MKSLKQFFVLLCLLSSAVFAGQPVNINTATADELATSLVGIGMSKAEAIVAYRSTNGAFKHADELVNIKGIGLKTVERNRDNILLASSEPADKKK